MIMNDVYRDSIETITDIKDIFNRDDVLTIIFLRGYDIDKVLDTLEESRNEDLENYEFLKKKFVGVVVIYNGKEAMAVARRLQKLYSIRCAQQEKLKKWYPKGTELATIGYIHFYNSFYDQGIKYITLAFIDDTQAHGNKIADNSYAFRFLASVVYNESLAKSISVEIHNRIINYKKINNIQIIYRLEDIINMEDNLYVTPPYKYRNIFEIENKNYFMNLFNSVFQKSKKKNEEKIANDGSALETLSKYLFQCISGSQFISRDKQNDSNEFDLIFRIIDNGNPLYEMFGDYLLVECKDHSKLVSSSIIRSFMANILSLNAKGGILISKKGITGNEIKNANLEIKKAYHRHGIVILSVTFKDIEDISNGKDFVWILLKKYEKVRFDDSSKTKHKSPT